MYFCVLKRLVVHSVIHYLRTCWSLWSCHVFSAQLAWFPQRQELCKSMPTLFKCILYHSSFLHLYFKIVSMGIALHYSYLISLRWTDPCCRITSFLQLFSKGIHQTVSRIALVITALLSQNYKPVITDHY